MTPSSKRRIPMTVTFLEMMSRPAMLPPPAPRGKVALLKSEKPLPVGIIGGLQMFVEHTADATCFITAMFIDKIAVAFFFIQRIQFRAERVHGRF